MNRVSDALKRATEDGVYLVTQPTGDGKRWVEEPITADVEVKINDRIATTIPESPKQLTRSFRKRMQELMFGWGLGKIKEFPLVTVDVTSPAGDQYRILREHIKKSCNQEGRGSLAVMSAVKGDGKTTVAVNLAAVMALDFDKQVLLIDADLRGSTVHHYFGLNSTPGLADYLRSEPGTDLMGFVQNTPLRGLKVFPAGNPTNLSSEILATNRAKSLLTEISLKLPGHQIIVDTPPVLSTPDPLVLADQVDNIVMVVRAGTTPRKCLSDAMKLLGSDKVKGLILNGAELGLAAKYYHYSLRT
jgi:capsular exopolysaccharide synthesis family protein